MMYGTNVDFGMTRSNRSRGKCSSFAASPISNAIEHGESFGTELRAFRTISLDASTPKTEDAPASATSRAT
jgi:hypothetical protein